LEKGYEAKEPEGKRRGSKRGDESGELIEGEIGKRTSVRERDAEK
jgi:hypothetical protein